MLSYWEKKNFVSYDLIVVGAGIVGLSTAIQYKESFPDREVLVLERGIFPTGASTKNAGFACFGSLTEILDDLEVLSEPDVYSLVERRYRGLLAIRKVFGDKALGYEPDHGFELITENELPALERLSAVNSMLAPIFDRNVFGLVSSPNSFGFGKTVKEVVENSFEGALNSGKFLQLLWRKCNELQIRIHTGAQVEKVLQQERKVLVKDPISGVSIQFHGNDLAICTNAFATDLIADLEVNPGRGLILMTSPLSYPIPWKGAFHYDKGYVYFRKIENRLLIGGGRNMAKSDEATTAFGTNPEIKQYLKGIIEEIVFPGYEPEIEMEWSGIMAFGPNKKPIVEMPFPSVGMAVRLGGMGVAIGWQTAKELVSLFKEV
jgi:gamma-glutamylputrescine oxidase